MLKINIKEEKFMWYFAWILGLGFAVLLGILNAMWLENEEDRKKSLTENHDVN